MPEFPSFTAFSFFQQKVWFYNLLELEPVDVIASFVIPSPSKDHSYNFSGFTWALSQNKNTELMKEKQPLGVPP